MPAILRQKRDGSKVRENGNRMDRIDRIKARQKDECGMMNIKQLAFHSSFILHHFFFILSILSILFLLLSCPFCFQCVTAPEKFEYIYAPVVRDRSKSYVN
jgi:hypothetical protein